MTRAEVLARCSTIFDMGLATEEQLRLLGRWVDFVLRYEHSLFTNGQKQWPYIDEFVAVESKRLGGLPTELTLANDEAGYNLVRFTAVLSHPCQQCAEDPRAWHTRPGFCEHRERER